MTLADSSAILDTSRVLPQHQAAVTLLQSRLSPPGSEQTWLDLACGRGQLVQVLENGLTPDSRSRLSFVGLEADQRHGREAVKLAEQLGLAKAEMRIGDLKDLPNLVSQDERLDFITLTNTVHEVAPADIPVVLVTAITRLSNAGGLYVSDMELIRPLELGAVAWTSDEVTGLLGSCLDSLGVDPYRPDVQRWQHSSTASWSAYVERQHFGLTDREVADRQEEAVAAVRQKVVTTLELKLEGCRTALETLTRYGSETGDEEAAKDSLVYDYWAITRALEAFA